MYMDMKLCTLFEKLEKKSAFFWIIVGIVLVGLLGLLDYLTGKEIVFTLFYFVPIVLVTLAVNRKVGLFMSFTSALTMVCAEVAAGQTYSQPAFYFLNTLIRTLFYSCLAWLVGALYTSQTDERLAARTDFVTGANNARYFNELLKMEIDRIRRYPH